MADLKTFMDALGVTHLWDRAMATFAPIIHKHSASDINSGTLPVARGGTGKSALNQVNLSAFNNDAGFITTGDIPEGAAASTTAPKALGAAAAAGSELAFSRGDHVHPYTVANKSTYGAVKVDDALNAGSTNPVQNSKVTAELNKKANDAALAAVAKSGAYGDLTGLPTIPTNNNQLLNGAGYQTATQVQNAVKSAVAGIFKWGGSIGNETQFNSTFGTTPGDVPMALDGNVYNMGYDFVANNLFPYDEGKSFPAGTNIVVCANAASENGIGLEIFAGSFEIATMTDAEIDAAIGWTN